MIRIEYRLTTHRTLLGGQAEVPRYRGRLADLGYRTGHRRVAIAVDHQARVGLQHRSGIECRRQAIGDAGDADVPGDMPLQFAARAARAAPVRPGSCDRRGRRPAAGPIGRPHAARARGMVHPVTAMLSSSAIGVLCIREWLVMVLAHRRGDRPKATWRRSPVTQWTTCLPKLRCNRGASCRPGRYALS